jgi:hypothetical protein
MPDRHVDGEEVQREQAEDPRAAAHRVELQQERERRRALAANVAAGQREVRRRKLRHLLTRSPFVLLLGARHSC